LRPGGPRVTALGGGHGLAVTLAAVRRYATAVTAVVSVADDGGSSGRLREMIGIPAPGDLRRCLGALADPASVWSQAFEYRFPGRDDLAGHALGNLVIAVLTQVTGDFAAALEHAARLLQVEGRVVPATTVPVDLVARVAGHDVVGQVNVARSRGAIERLSLVPGDAPAPPEAVQAVRAADQVVLGPGSLFTSVLAAAVVPELADAIRARRGGRIFVANLPTDDSEAGGFPPVEQLRALLEHRIAVDVMVYDPAAAGDLPPDVEEVRCVPAAVARVGGGGHDPVPLAAVLSGLGRPAGPDRPASPG
jgi:uncharacterized cofD-like protein